MIQLDLTPNTKIAESIRAEARMSLFEACAEFIDNSLDHGATDIRIDLPRDEIRISDNGAGCADLQRMLKLGTHSPDGRRIGRYGVGFNMAAIWLARSVEIESVSGAKRHRVTLSWDEIPPDWKVSAPPPEDASGAASGMSIRLYNLFPRRRHVSDLVNSLAARYPFLKSSGKALLVNGAAVPGSELPPLGNTLIGEGEWEGRAYRLTAGLVDRIPPPWKHGFAVMLRDRVLADGLSDGCGEYSRHGFFALVELLEGVELEDGTASRSWPVAKTKTGLTDSIHLFLESLLKDVEPLLQAAETESSNLMLRGLELQLSGSWLNDALFGVKEKRPGPGGSTGSADPTGTGGPRTRATNTDPAEQGNIKLGRGIGRQVRVRFASLDSDSDLAMVNHNSARTECVLNESHPFVRANRDLGLLQTRMLVAQMVEIGRAHV